MKRISSLLWRIKRGFTLIEILIAVTLLLVIAVAAFSTFRGGTAAWQQGTAHAQRRAEVRATLEMMSRELSKAILIYSDGDYEIDFFSSPGRIYFIASTEAPGPGQPDIMKVRYSLVGGEITRTTARIDEDITVFPDPPPDGFPALASHITELTFRFLDNQPLFLVDPWRDDWDSRTTAERGAEQIRYTVNTLPDAIEITFTFDDPNDDLPAREFKTVIAPARAEPLFGINISLSPSSSGEVVQGSPASTNVTVTLTAGEPAAVTLSVVMPPGISDPTTSGIDYTLSPTSGTPTAVPFPATLNFTTTATATSGIHTIRVQGSVGGRVVADATYILNIVTPAVLHVSPLAITAELVQAGTPGTWVDIGTVGVSNAGGGTLSWSASENLAWLQLSPIPTSGTTTIETDFVTVQADADLAVGIHLGAITFAGANMTRIVDVTLNVITIPTVVTHPATSITEAGATLNATITSDGGAPILERRLAWGTTYPPGCTDCDWASVVVDPIGAFNHTLAGLTPGTTYYFQGWAINRAGSNSGAILSFTTTGLGVSPLSITGTVVEGTTAWKNIGTINVTNPGDGTLSWSRSINVWWLSTVASGIVGPAPDVDTLTVHAMASHGDTHLPIGPHTGIITFKSGPAGAPAVTRTVAVTLTVVPPPELHVTPILITHTLTEGTGWTNIGTVSVANPGAYTLNWSASVTLGATWLQILPPTSGTTNPTPDFDTVTVRAHASGVAPGVHTGRITFTGALPAIGTPDYVYVTLTVNNLPPTASFDWVPHPPAAGEVISFRNHSTDPGGIKSQSWSFGDGGTPTAWSPSHTYTTAGTYTVTLTVHDHHGASDSISRDITVGICDNFNDAGAAGRWDRNWYSGSGSRSFADPPVHPGVSIDADLGWGGPDTDTVSAIWVYPAAHDLTHPISSGPLLATGYVRVTDESEGYTLEIQVWDTGVAGTDKWRTVAYKWASHGSSTVGFGWTRIYGNYNVVGNVTRIRVFMHLIDECWWSDDRVWAYMDNITLLRH